MKKISILTMVVMLCMMCVPGSAMADSRLYSIAELPAHTTSHWQQTYEAYGRTIDVNIEVEIPNVSSAPVITVRRAAPIAEPLNSELKAWYKQAEKEDRVNRYSFRSNDFSTNFTHAVPPAWGEDRDSEFVVGAMSQRMQDLYDYDLGTPYAENNPLTVGEAIDLFQQRVAEYFPNEKLHLRTVYVTSRSFWKKNNQPISEKGYYSFNMSQTFHGIPFMASVHEAFTQFSVGNEDIWLESRGIARGSVHDENAWSFSACFYQESGVVYKDIPLLPFDAVKGAVEELILSGHVRWIDSVSLGYVQFDASNPDEQVLVPCWVVWCEYHPGGAKSERTGGENSSSNLMYDGNNDYYRPLIINAQTGEMIDPENDSVGRCLCPPIKTK